MRIFLILALSALSSIAADTPIAIVRGTNVLGTAIIDPARFAPPAGASNVVISSAKIGVVQKGWRYNPATGEFTDPAGKPIANGILAYVTREELLDMAIAVMDDMQAQSAAADANWAAADKDKVLRKTMLATAKLSEIAELLVKQQRALLQLEKPQ